jgi:hypothetical protein
MRHSAAGRGLAEERVDQLAIGTHEHDNVATGEAGVARPAVGSSYLVTT